MINPYSDLWHEYDHDIDYLISLGNNLLARAMWKNYMVYFEFR